MMTTQRPDNRTTLVEALLVILVLALVTAIGLVTFYFPSSATASHSAECPPSAAVDDCSR